MPQFSLQQIFVGITFIAAAILITITELPTNVLLLISIAGITATVLICAISRSVATACVLSLPLLWILNFAAYFIALSYLLGASGFTEIVFGRTAWILAWPVVLIQNSHPWWPPPVGDTMVGLLIVSLIEALGISFLTSLIRTRRNSHKHTSDRLH